MLSLRLRFSAGSQQLSKLLEIRPLLIILRLLTPSLALVRSSFFHQPNEHQWFDLEYMELISDNLGDVWFVSVFSWPAFGVCLTNTLYRAQPRSLCPVWYGMLRSNTFSKMVFET